MPVCFYPLFLNDISFLFFSHIFLFYINFYFYLLFSWHSRQTKSQTTTSSGGLEEPCKGDCVLPFKGGCYKPVTCPPIRNALLAYYWLPYKGHFLVISLFGLFLLLFNISLHCCFIDIAYCFHIIPSCPKFFISSSPEFGMPVKYL